MLMMLVMMMVMMLRIAVRDKKRLGGTDSHSSSSRRMVTVSRTEAGCSIVALMWSLSLHIAEHCCTLLSLYVAVHFYSIVALMPSLSLHIRATFPPVFLASRERESLKGPDSIGA